METTDQSIKRSLSDLSTSYTVKKACLEKSSVFGQVENLIKYRIFWLNRHYDNPINHYTFNDRQLRGVIDYLECFHNIQELNERIKSTVNNNLHIILIVSVNNLLEQQLISDVYNVEQMSSIYIYYEEGDEYQQPDSTIDENKKLIKFKDVYTDLKRLFRDVSKQVLIVGRQNFVSMSKILPTSSNTVHERTAILELSSKNDYFYNFINALTEIETSPNAKQMFIDECRHLYASEESVLKVIDDFDKTYVSSEAISWYTRTGFLYGLLNQTLRQQNIDALLLLHFFIRDLDMQLLDASERENTSIWQKYTYLYRGQRMSIEEIQEMRRTHRNCFFLSFLSTTANIEVARMFSGAGDIRKEEPIQPVLFYLDCSRLSPTRGVADICQLSDIEDEEEILFSPLYSFSVRDVNYDDDEKVWRVDCDLCGDETDLPLLLHQHLIKLDIVVRVLMSAPTSVEEDSENVCQIFTDGLCTLLNELIISDGNMVTLDENATTPTSRPRHAVTALFLLKGLRYFNSNSLSHKPNISAEMITTLFDCLAVMCKDKYEFQRALVYFEKAISHTADNPASSLARQVNIAQIYRILGQYDQAWNTYWELLKKYFGKPDNSNFHIFNEIASAIPNPENENTIIDWLPNIYGYLEYVYAKCKESSTHKKRFSSMLIEKYRALGFAYWYIAYDKEHTLLCYDRWKDLLEPSDYRYGAFFLYLAHVYYVDDPPRAKHLYEQAIAELSLFDNQWTCELAVCNSRLGCLQNRKTFFRRSFYLLLCVADIDALVRNNLEEVAECYFYTAKGYYQDNSSISKTVVQQFCEQALRLFLNVKPPTSSFRDMRDCVELLENLQDHADTNNNSKRSTKEELLQKAYNQISVTGEELKKMLEDALSTINNSSITISEDSDGEWQNATIETP